MGGSTGGEGGKPGRPLGACNSMSRRHEIYIYTYTHVRKCMYARAWGRNYARASIRTLLSASARNLSDDIQLVRLARSLPLFRGDLYALGNRETEVGCIIQIF